MLDRSVYYARLSRRLAWIALAALTVGALFWAAALLFSWDIDEDAWLFTIEWAVGVIALVLSANYARKKSTAEQTRALAKRQNDENNEQERHPNCENDEKTNQAKHDYRQNDEGAEQERNASENTEQERLAPRLLLQHLPSWKMTNYLFRMDGSKLATLRTKTSHYKEFAYTFANLISLRPFLSETFQIKHFAGEIDLHRKGGLAPTWRIYFSSGERFIVNGQFKTFHFQVKTEEGTPVAELTAVHFRDVFAVDRPSGSMLRMYRDAIPEDEAVHFDKGGYDLLKIEPSLLEDKVQYWLAISLACIARLDSQD
ncbi:hypothetical protein G4V62_10370 [Bacillaceae bacterium SIJ1]|uniref:hypothetical protein n=1 Tax=Litoribacterium kuwaitense TaxID=1398745 RepID=UPI001BA50189|nr:hypothetical protein [Litoribacterium kuwaitense]NGP45338.1 hypothetical protein [Litoribacterium kuwaitense]